MPLPPSDDDDLGRLLDGFRPLVFRLLPVRGAAGDIDRGARGPQFRRDAAARAACCARDQSDFSLKFHELAPTYSPAMPCMEVKLDI